MGGALQGCRVLLADDEPLIAIDLAEELEAAGAVVVGPVGTVERALELLARETVDAAVLDIMLQGALVYPVADLLAGLGVPFVFATGYRAEVVPVTYAGVPICGKPFQFDAVITALNQAVAGRGRT